jgi:hypothetical protein
MDYGAISGYGQIASTMVSNYYAGKVTKIQDETANTIRGLNNATVQAENSRDAAITGIARWRQSIYNKRVMENAGKDVEALAVNHFRQKDTMARQSFAAQIGYAEQNGRMQAMAAASGVSGNVTDMLAFSMRLKQGMENTQRANAERQIDGDYSRRQREQWFANMDQIDNGLLFDKNRQQDYGFNDTQAPSLLTGIKVADIKAIAQGTDFKFNLGSGDTSWAGVDYQQRGDA